MSYKNYKYYSRFIIIRVDACHTQIASKYCRYIGLCCTTYKQVRNQAWTQKYYEQFFCHSSITDEKNHLIKSRTHLGPSGTAISVASSHFPLLKFLLNFHNKITIYMIIPCKFYKPNTRIIILFKVYQTNVLKLTEI